MPTNCNNCPVRRSCVSSMFSDGCAFFPPKTKKKIPKLIQKLFS